MPRLLALRFMSFTSPAWAFVRRRCAYEMIAGARQRGLDVTTEAYPYTAGMTDLSSAIFDEGWQGRQGGIAYGDLQWAATGERLTPESFARYRKQGGMVAIHSIPEEIVRLAVADPTVMIASDGILDNGKGHPRAAGTYARVLGRYVREEHALSLNDAIRKMSLMPAQRLGLSNKGRIRVGADADITSSIRIALSTALRSTNPHSIRQEFRSCWSAERL